MRLIFLTTILLISSNMLWAYHINGTVTNEQGKPLKYATIYIEETQTGTSANSQGLFSLSIPTGTYSISFRALGYSPTYKTVSVKNSDITLNIKLYVQSYILQGVTVRADDEDPAYSIMRKSIARAPGFINQAKSYTSEVYIKGVAKIIKIPRIIQKHMDVNGKKPKPGDVYVNESLNKIRFKSPGTYTQEVISVNNSFPISDSDVPVIQLISGSIYESQDDFYISPFAPNAFAHYNFSYEGLLQDGAWFIDKIKVTPKRKNKLLMSGYLYIVEDLWCLYSYDIEMNPAYTHLNMKQHYAPVKGNNYFPINLFVNASISAMGVKAEANYTSTIKYDSVILNPKFSQQKIKKAIAKIDTSTYVEEEKNPKIALIDQKIDKILESNNLSNREMVQMQKLMCKKASMLKQDEQYDPMEIIENYKTIVKKENLNQDSVYWDSIRPIPASADEKISYQKAIEEKEKIDSASTFTKVIRIAAIGNYEWQRSLKFYIHYPGLLNTENIDFNPVDGAKIRQRIKLRWQDSTNIFEMQLKAGYAFHRKSFFGRAHGYYSYLPLKRGDISFDAGYLANDFNNFYGAPHTVNAIYNLLLKENYKAFYKDTYISLLNRIDVANGLEWSVGAKWQQTDTLSNNTDFSFLYKNEKYEPNTPYNESINDNLAPKKMFQIKTSLRYTPKHFYKINDKGHKHYTKTKYPTFWLNYEGAFKLKNNYAKYHHVNLSISQDIDLYSVSSIKYQLNGGLFSSKNNLHFSNFKHFYTDEMIFTSNSFKNNFFLLNNYENSTAEKYFEGHFKYSTQFLLLKRLPIISNQLWTENLYANVLYVKGHKPYYEAGYSIGQIFFAGEIGVFTGFKGSDFKSFGVRASFKFN